MTRPSRRGWIALLTAALALAGAGLLIAGARDIRNEPERRTGEERARATERARAERARAARPHERQARPAVPAAVRALAARLPPRERVAQLFLVGFSGTTPAARFFEELRTRGWGGVVLTEENLVAPDQLAALAGEATVVARDAGRVPPLVAPRAVTGFEPPRQSPDDRPAAAREAARAAALGLRAAGFSLAFAPDVNMPIEAAGGSFGDDPVRVGRLARAAVDGWRAGGIVSAPGHFPGQGAATQDPLEGPSSVGLPAADLRRRDLRPFRAIVRRAPAMLVSSATFAAFDAVTPAALTPAIVGRLLRGELGYAGVAMSDDLAGAAAGTGTSIGEAAVRAFAAGIDMVQVLDPAEREAAYGAVLRAVERRRLSPARMRGALLRVLALKRAAGLLEPPAGAGAPAASAP